MILFCIDIGNTHTHFGRVSRDGAERIHSMPSEALTIDDHPILDFLRSDTASTGDITGIACCSVVPERTAALYDQVTRSRPDLPWFQLTHQAGIGFPLVHPLPAGVGQDRLANAVAAHALCGAPVIVVDSGTAVTCDVITPEGGFEGGVIAPGHGLLRDSLHEKTAQLPKVDEASDSLTSIGRNTVEAIQIGCSVGFRGMVAALISAQRTELAGRGLNQVPVVVSGGSADRLTALIEDGDRLFPDLTLRGLFEAYLLNHTKGNCSPADIERSEPGTA